MSIIVVILQKGASSTSTTRELIFLSCNSICDIAQLILQICNHPGGRPAAALNLLGVTRQRVPRRLGLAAEGMMDTGSGTWKNACRFEPMFYFTSDTHFGDPRVLRIDRRPFATMREHDSALIKNWNEVVSADDEVWHLGDFARGTAPVVGGLLSALNGQKHLIVGNNDGPATLTDSGWASVQHYAEMTLDGHLLILCHYPFRTWNKIGKKSINLHGHSHGRLTPAVRQYDVGVDAQGLRPVSLKTILASGPRGRPS